MHLFYRPCIQLPCLQGCDLEGAEEVSTSSSLGSSENTWETATASRDDEGFIVFDGGNYSWSPINLLHNPPLQVPYGVGDEG